MYVLIPLILHSGIKHPKNGFKSQNVPIAIFDFKLFPHIPTLVENGTKMPTAHVAAIKYPLHSPTDKQNTPHCFCLEFFI